MQLTVITATGQRNQLEVPLGQLNAADLQAAVARCLGVHAAGLRLVRAGQPLNEDSAVSKLKDGDTLLAVVAPRAPPKAVRDAVAGGPPEEDEAEELLRLRLPPDAPRWQRAALAFARQRLRLPEGLLALAVHAGLRFWLGLLAWMAGARAAAAWELGPVYIIASILAVMLLNLGTRREGEWSAYSLFNPGMRRLPGQMTAEQLDAQVRRGHM
ncbi:hypothetical protein ABPG77_006386 [Micractinium sp. CCAP 211/92]